MHGKRLVILGATLVTALPASPSWASDFWFMGDRVTVCWSGCGGPGASSGGGGDNPGWISPGVLLSIPVLATDIWLLSRLASHRPVKIRTPWLELTSFVSSLGLTGIGAGLIATNADELRSADLMSAKQRTDARIKLGCGVAFAALALPALVGSSVSILSGSARSRRGEARAASGALMQCRSRRCKVRVAVPSLGPGELGGSDLRLGLLAGTF